MRPQGDPVSGIVLERVASQTLQTLFGDDGMSQVTVRATCYGVTVMEAQAIADAARAALPYLTTGAVVTDDEGGYVADFDLFFIALSIQLWETR